MNAQARAADFPLTIKRPLNGVTWSGENVEVESWFVTLGAAIDDSRTAEGETKAYVLTAKGPGSELIATVRRLRLSGDGTVSGSDILYTFIDSDGVPCSRGGHRAVITIAIGLLARRFAPPEATADAKVALGDRVAIEPEWGPTPRGRFVGRTQDAIRLQCDGVSEGQIAELRFDAYPRLYRAARALP